VKRLIPDRGDILHFDLDPVLGREQQGQRYVLVLTTADFNRFGLALVAPITQGGQFARENGFTVPMMGAGTNTQGVVLCNQVRMLDFKQRGGKVIETAPENIVDDVLARVRALLD
jgi:mRNA-degrading endonuclease toxin of MazEF toxin-antitoxin module